MEPAPSSIHLKQTKANEILGLDPQKVKLMTKLGISEENLQEIQNEQTEKFENSIKSKNSNLLQFDRKNSEKALDILGEDPSKNKIISTLGIDEEDIADAEEANRQTEEIKMIKIRKNSAAANKKKSTKALKTLGYDPSDAKLESKFGENSEQIRANVFRPAQLLAEENSSRRTNSFQHSCWQGLLPPEHILNSTTIQLSQNDARAFSIYCSNPSFEGVSIIMGQLQNSLDEGIKFLGGSAVVKLNTMCENDFMYKSTTPSDVITKDSGCITTRKLLDVELRILGGVRNPNSEVKAFVNATNQSLVVRNGKQALDLLCQSSFIFHEIDRSLDNDNIQVEIVLQEFIDCPLENKWRIFVANDQPTAASQYYHFIHFPDLIKDKSYLEKAMIAFVQKINFLIPKENYTMDVILVNNKLKILELGKLDGAGCCLFSSKSSKVLEQPFELAIRTKPDEDCLLNIVPSWRKYIGNSVEQQKRGYFQSQISLTYSQATILLMGAIFTGYYLRTMIKK